MPKRDRSSYMRQYRAQKAAEKRGEPAPAQPRPQPPDGEPWRAMTADDAQRYLTREATKTRRRARLEAGKCTICGVPNDDDFRTCEGCRAAAKRRRDAW